MFRTLMAVMAMCMLSACVTPISLEAQTPKLAYKAPEKMMVGVVEQRERVLAGKPANFAGYARMNGIPFDWTIKIIAGPKSPEGDKTMSQFLAGRIASGLKSGGSDVVELALAKPLSDEEATKVLTDAGAKTLVTVVDKDWHFDVNTNWVGKFKFNTDVDVIVQRVGGGTILRKSFQDSQAIQGEGDNSWPNMILAAYKAKLEQILSDPEVVAAISR